MRLKARIVSFASDKSYLPWEFLSIVLLGLKQRNWTLTDIKAFLFVLLSPIFYFSGFKGKLDSPFGRVMIGNREHMKAVAYGAFKTHFCYLKDIKRIFNGRSFFPMVVDVGANIGDFTLAMAPRSGTIVAIEPGTENFDSLLSNIAINGVRNVVALNLAAHDRNETLAFRGEGSALRVVGSGGTREARGIPLDQVLGHLEEEKIDVLKIDVQGHEEKALLGIGRTLSEKKVGLVLVEVHVGWGLPIGRIASLMESYGYGLTMKNEYLFNQPHLYFVAEDAKN